MLTLGCIIRQSTCGSKANWGRGKRTCWSLKVIAAWIILLFSAGSITTCTTWSMYKVFASIDIRWELTNDLQHANKKLWIFQHFGLVWGRTSSLWDLCVSWMLQGKLLRRRAGKTYTVHGPHATVFFRGQNKKLVGTPSCADRGSYCDFGGSWQSESFERPVSRLKTV